MAINTANERAAALGLGLSFLTVLPLPDGEIDSFDRRQALGLYRIESIVPPGGIDTEDKRRSALGNGLDFLMIAPIPDDSLDTKLDRLHISAYYRLERVSRPTPPSRILLVEADDRELVVRSDNRELLVEPDDRLLIVR